MSFIGAIGGVIAAIYAAMAYYRMRAEDSPTLHVRFLDPIENNTYYLVLEIHPGKRSAQYSEISVKGGSISLAKPQIKKDIQVFTTEQKLSRLYKENIYVPSAIARDFGPDLSIILKMNKSAVISLRNCQSFFSTKIKVTVNDKMAR